MDPQIFKLINDRSNKQDDTLERIETMLAEHIQKDEVYWRKIDVQEGQLGLLKWVFGGTVTTLAGSFIAWIIAHIKG